MAGNQHGGQRAALTNITRHGKDFYARIGAMGGRKSNTGGFASDKAGKDGLTGRQRARIAGAEGGRISRRRKVAITSQAIQSTQSDFDLAA